MREERERVHAKSAVSKCADAIDVRAQARLCTFTRTLSSNRALCIDHASQYIREEIMSCLSGVVANSTIVVRRHWDASAQWVSTARADGAHYMFAPSTYGQRSADDGAKEGSCNALSACEMRSSEHHCMS